MTIVEHQEDGTEIEYILPDAWSTIKHHNFDINVDILLAVIGCVLQAISVGCWIVVLWLSYSNSSL